MELVQIDGYLQWQQEQMKSDTTSKSNHRFATILVTCLFFLWGFALNLNPILIPHLKKESRLSDFQSALIDSASLSLKNLKSKCKWEFLHS